MQQSSVLTAASYPQTCNDIHVVCTTQQLLMLYMYYTCMYTVPVCGTQLCTLNGPGQISTDDTHTIWKQLPNLPYHYATLCAVNDVLIAIGGKYDERCSSTTTSCLYAFNGQQWQHIGEMSSKGYWLDVAVLHQREMLVLDGCSLAVMKGDVEG